MPKVAHAEAGGNGGEVVTGGLAQPSEAVPRRRVDALPRCDEGRCSGGQHERQEEHDGYEAEQGDHLAGQEAASPGLAHEQGPERATRQLPAHVGDEDHEHEQAGEGRAHAEGLGGATGLAERGHGGARPVGDAGLRRESPEPRGAGTFAWAKRRVSPRIRWHSAAPGPKTVVVSLCLFSDASRRPECPRGQGNRPHRPTRRRMPAATAGG